MRSGGRVRRTGDVFDVEKLGARVPSISLFRVVAITSVFIVGYSAFTIAGNATRSYQLSVQTRQLQQSLAQDQVQYAHLDALRRYMRSDAFIESQARQEGLSLPGDVPVVVSAPSPPAANDRSPAGDWWERYLGN